MFKNRYFLAGFILVSVLLWPLFAAPFFSHQDDVQIIRLHQMNECIKDLQIPCRWVPDLGMLYGYPLFNYYAPLPYYVGEFFYLLSGNLIFSVKMMFALSFLFSYVFMFLLSKRLWGEKGALISGVFYAYAPYHAVDFYVRGAMGEMWALMFYPAIMWAFLRLKENKNISNMLWLALFSALLITSHNLSTLIFMPLVAFLVGIFVFQTKDFRFLKYTLTGFLLTFLLSAFYLLPVQLEKNWVHVDSTISGYFSYTEHFKGLNKMLISRYWGYGPSVREVPGGERDGLPYQIGWVHLLGFLLALFTLYKFPKEDKNIKLMLIFSLAMTLASIFMIHPRSEIVWKMIDPLKYLQFPWRFLMLVIFFISLVAGSVLIVLEKRWQTIAAGILLCLVFVLNFSYFRPEAFLQISDKDLLSGDLWQKQIRRSIFDFLPKSADAPPADVAKSRYEILAGDTNISNYKQGSNWFQFKAQTNSHSIIRLSQYYFPEWVILDNGKPLKIEYKNNNLGLMTIILGEGNHTIDAKLYNTPVRTIGNILSLFGIIIFAVLSLMQIKSVKEYFKYLVVGMNR